MQITRSNSTETAPGPADWFTGTVYIVTVAAPSGATIRRHRLPQIAAGCRIGLSKLIFSWRSRTVAACCALGGVSSGVKIPIV